MTIYNFSAGGITFGDYEFEKLETAMEIFAKELGYVSWRSMTAEAIENSGAGNIEIREVYENLQLGPDIAPDQTTI